MTALLRGCLWKGEKCKSENLDSRWGDTSISAPTLGAWNQLSSEWSTSGHDPGYGSDLEKERSVKRINTAKSLRPRIPRPPQSNSAAKKETRAENTDRPVFIYKPASKNFLRHMAALGNPQPQPETLLEEHEYSSSSYNPRLIVYKDEGDDLVKDLSEASRSTSPLENPQELRDIPHHPSYRSFISSPSPSVRSRSSARSSSSKSRRNAIAPPSPTQSPPTSRRSSPHPEFTPVIYEDLASSMASATSLTRAAIQKVDRPFTGKNAVSKKNKSHKRKVTEVMVPSSAELFG